MRKFLEYVKGSPIWELRDNDKTRNLSAEDRADVLSAISRHNVRYQWRKSQYGIAPLENETPVERLRRQRESELTDLLRPTFLKMYNHATSGWAGGNNHFRVKVANTPESNGYSTRVWSSNGKWSGNDGHFTVTVAVNYRRIMAQYPGLQTAGGMLTTHAKEIAPGLFEASWVRQGRGFEVYAETGYILHDGDEWYHGKTEKSVRQLKTRREKFAQRAEKSKRFSEVLRQMSTEDMIVKFGALPIGIRDSLRAGNCEPGTRNWIAKHFPGRDSGTIAEVLSAGSPDHFVIRAVQAAILRQSKTAQKMIA